MQTIAQYAVSFHHHDRTGVRMIRMEAIDGSYNQATFPDKFKVLFVSWSSSFWRRDEQAEANPPALIDDDITLKDWVANNQAGRTTKKQLIDILNFPAGTLFSGGNFTIAPSSGPNPAPVLDLVAKSALPLTSAAAQQTNADRFQPDPEIDPKTGKRMSPRGGNPEAKKMRMDRNNPLKSWF